ncbi:hypothetical protein K458DRAFT_170556 [Lentithecium fluviatile CBS 122367]|uniref:DUF6594 domain-containing protein n=1 Tax=Lentithecium fluviatile CBS 122367 TaxID=1168545 RepID=A0A6G1JB68_9PLEO|nr:hypothetical protein K458DRAFT_170556 [Lentithecium fluviatile CBS 122367]
MTDRRASFEGPHHSRQSPDASSDHEKDLASGAQPASSAPRQHLQRARATSDDSHPTSSTWPDTDKGDSYRTARGGRATPRKLSKTSSHSDTELDSPATSEKAAVGFLPKLSRILEGKESQGPRRHRNSTVSSEEEHTPVHCRSRPAEDATLSRRPIRQKHGSLQRRAESLANLPNPSLISVLSGVTQQSNVSSGSNESNSTVTQQSYDLDHLIKRKPTRVRKRLQTKRGPLPSKPETMEAQPSGVFRYMNGGLTSEQFLSGELHASRPSTASSASSATSSATSSAASHETGDDQSSSNEDKEEPEVESPLTSPASTRRPDPKELHDHDGDSVSDMSVREGSPVSHHQPSVSDDVEDSDQEEGAHQEGGAEDDYSEYSEEDGEDNASATDELKHHQHRDPQSHDHLPHAHHMALERIPPPRLPSASVSSSSRHSSRHGDQHTRRLKRQEQALSDHVLQAPQPHRDFQFVGGPSPQTLPPQPAMPMYDPYMHSGASQANFYPTAQHAPPPVPPPPVGYYSPTNAPPIPYSPGYENSLAMTARPPMPAPSVMVPAPPLQYPAHPPHQPYPRGTDLRRTTVVGYELLADRLCEGSKVKRRHPNEDAVVPMYRKFEQLNHRVLLHLQDEISELEEELRYLDECIAHCSPRNGAGLVHPASRRGDARYGSETHSRRTELLGRIYLKLGQYNSALTSFNNLVNNVDTADKEDIQAYRTWIEKRTPIDYAETRFLEHGTDLLAVSQRRSASIGGVPAHQSAAIFLPLILVLPLMAFAIVPGLLGRLFVLVAIGGGIVKVIMSTQELMELMTPREWTGCFSVYFGFMAVLAALVH